MPPDDHNASTLDAPFSVAPAVIRSETGTAFAFGKYRLYPEQRLLLADDQPVDLKSRAFEAVLALVEACGALVTKKQLHERLWPDTFVDPHNLDQQISTLRKAFGEDRHLIHTETGRGWRIAAPVRVISALPEAEPATNIPSAVSQLIGRENELAKLPELIAQHRLVTLTGPGGIGKTQLSLETARRVLRCFSDGIWIAELAPMMDAGLVPGAIARALRIVPGPDRSLVEQLVAALRRKHLLLVIDNCEHLIKAVAQVTETLLHGAPRLHILATSREPLEAEGEHVFRVDPLMVPPADNGDVDRALDHSAVQLFVARAQAADRTFALDERTRPGVIKICRHLDGIPLALELAAGCVASIGVDALAGRLHDRFWLLTGGRRCALPRHQTLAATLEWGYALLTQPEQAVLRRVAVFAGSFTLDGAGAVAASDGIDAMQASGHIIQLVRKSLVALDVRGAVTRYRLLDTTRAYACQKLAETDEAGSISRRHAGHVRTLLQQAQTLWQTTPAAELAPIYAPEIDNIRLALDWAFEAGGDPDEGVAIVTAAIPLWTLLSTLTEFRHFVHLALAHLATKDSRCAHQEMALQLALGTSSLWTSRILPETYTAATRALQLAERLGDVERQLRALYLLWIHQLSAGEYRNSHIFADRFRDIADNTQDMPARLTGDRMQAFSLFYLGDYSEAMASCERVLNGGYTDPHHQSVLRFSIDQRVGTQVCLALILWLQGFPDQAARLAEASMEEARTLNHANSLCLSVSFGTCYVAALSEDLSTVEKFVPYLNAVAEKHVLGMWKSDSLIFKAWIAVRRGDISTGLSILTEKLGDFQRATVDLHQPLLIGALAQALAAAGRMKEGLTVIDKAIDASMRCAGHWCLPELMRIRAALTLQQDLPAAADAAEKDLLQALQLADGRGAKSWHLRIATDLARLWHGQNRTADARDVLMPIYGWFTEGFNTADVKGAAALMKSLR